MLEYFQHSCVGQDIPFEIINSFISTTCSSLYDTLVKSIQVSGKASTHPHVVACHIVGQ